MADKKTHFGRAGEFYAMSELLLFLVRFSTHWRFLWIPRTELLTIRNKMVQTPRSGPGRRSIADEEAKSDSVGLTVTIEKDAAWGWNTDLRRFFDRWPDELSIVVGGPGTAKSGRPAPTPQSEEDPAR